ncbi:MAG TPA: alpha/beta hydrolase [Candidatus Tumulicola sp.]|nr:alpha/beta hydrolase [Candidatus Tumulicola sp.]
MTQGPRRLALDDGAITTLECWGERGPLVLAVHGMTSSRKSWQRLARHLDGRYRVVAYDQRGHGDSAGVEGPMSLERGVRDLENVVAALGEPVDTLVGHSWGGAVAILAAPHLPVRRVVAIDPMIHQADAAWYEEYLEELREQFAFTGSARDARTREAYAAWDPVDVEAKVHAVHVMTTVPIERLMRENPPATWDLRPAIAAFPKPLLLAMADAGEGINDAGPLEAVANERSKSVDLRSFPGAGHNLHRTAFDAFASAVDEFLER